MSQKATFTSAKCVLVIGATSGIGKDLALAIHRLPSKPTVIVSGRRTDRLDEIVKSNSSSEKGLIVSKQVDVKANAASLKSFAESVIAEHPELDAVIFAAGIQHIVDFTKPSTVDVSALADEFNTNYVSILSLTTAFLPHFLKLNDAGRASFIVPITSGLAIRPMPTVPNYCATKAALHSMCLSLRSQFRGTRVNVIEIFPPLVESELHDHQGMSERFSKFWMPLSEFTPKTMAALERGDEEIAIGSSAQEYEKYEKDKQGIIDKTFWAIKDRT